jgi:hypothetical protein
MDPIQYASNLMPHLNQWLGNYCRDKDQWCYAAEIKNSEPTIYDNDAA